MRKGYIKRKKTTKEEEKIKNKTPNVVQIIQSKND